MIAAMFAALLLAGVAQGPLDPPADPAALDHYQGDRFAVTVQEITDGIYVFGRRPSWRFSVQPNTLVVVNEHDVVVVDGGYGSYSEDIVREIRRITDKPVSVVVNTHWHQDHNLGHYVFKREWPQARVIAHEETRARMVGDDDFLGKKTPVDLDEVIDRQRKLLEEARKEGRSPAVLAYLADLIEGLPAARSEFAKASLVPADETFSKRLVLHRGDRRIELLYFGVANTRGDIVVWLPGERIVAAGDVVVRPTPYGFGSSPAGWANVLRSINGLDYQILVPGHGDLQRDTDYVAQLAGMMDVISSDACTALAAGAEDGAEVSAAVDWSRFEPALTGGDPLLSRLFEGWFKKPIGAGALEEIANNPSVCA
jgi:cyclase